MQQYQLNQINELTRILITAMLDFLIIGRSWYC